MLALFYNLKYLLEPKEKEKEILVHKYFVAVQLLIGNRSFATNGHMVQ